MIEHGNGMDIGKALAAEGLLPPECVNVEILMPGDGIIQIRYTVNVLQSDLPKIGRAFTAMNVERPDAPAWREFEPAQPAVLVYLSNANPKINLPEQWVAMGRWEVEGDTDHNLAGNFETPMVVSFEWNNKAYHGQCYLSVIGPQTGDHWRVKMKGHGPLHGPVDPPKIRTETV